VYKYTLDAKTIISKMKSQNYIYDKLSIFTNEKELNMAFKILDKMIRSAVLDLIKEQQEEKKPEEKPKEEKKPAEKEDKKPAKKKKAKVDIKGSLGRGRFLDFVQTAGTRVEQDAAGLLKDLGISSASGESDLDKVNNVLRQAVRNNSTMAAVYETPSFATVGDKKVLRMPVKTEAKEQINPRNAMKFVYWTLIAAEKGGLLVVENDVNFAKATDTDVPTLFSKQQSPN